MRTRHGHTMIAALLVALLAGCGVTKQEAMTTSDSLVAANPQEYGPGMAPGQVATPSSRSRSTARASSPRRSSPSPSRTSSSLVASGPPVAVSVNTTISSKTAGVGSSWTGTVESDVYRNGRVVIPAGSTVHGTVLAAQPAERGERAMLRLGLTSVNVDGRSYRLRAGSEAIIAGSTRARNLGAIAAGTAGGAIIGKAVGGSGKSTVIGGLIGAAATGGAVAASKGYQVVVKPGTEITFTTS